MTLGQFLLLCLNLCGMEVSLSISKPSETFW